MLLVDDHQPEFVKRHRVLDERVRANDKVNRARGQLRLDLTAFFRRRRASDERHAEARGFQQPANGDEVLFGQDLGWRHEGNLEAVLHRHDCGDQRDDGLARSDIALEQTVHRLRPLHVFDDLGNHLLLIAGELERQHAARGLADFVGDDRRSRLSFGVRPPPPHDQPELKEEELLEDQATLRRRSKRVERLDGGASRRKMHVEQRRAPLNQLLPCPDVRRKRIHDARRQLRQRLMHDRTLHLCRQRAGFFVDRDDAPGM